MFVAAIQPPAQHIANGTSWYDDPHIIVAAVVSFAVGWLAHFLTNRRDAKNRTTKAKDDFLRVIDELSAKLDAIDRTDDPAKPIRIAEAEDLFVENSIPVLMEAVRKVRRHISAEQSIGLTVALGDYKQYQAKYRGITGRCKIALQEQPDFSKAVHTYLERLDYYVSNRPVA